MYVIINKSFYFRDTSTYSSLELDFRGAQLIERQAL